MLGQFDSYGSGDESRLSPSIVIAGANVRWANGGFDPVRRLVRNDDGRHIGLTPIESDLLLLLLTRNGLPVPLAEMGEQIWGHMEPSKTGVYQQAIRSLRVKLN
jgi:DNA-binding response OmpR family regulator